MHESRPIRADLAAQVHYTDPRVRRLAAAWYQLATGQSYAEWLALGKDNPQAMIAEARDWMRAAVAAGLLTPPATASAGREGSQAPQSPAALPGLRLNDAEA